MNQWLWSFRIKVMAAVIAALLLVLGTSHYFIYRSARQEQFKQLRNQLMTVAQTATLAVDAAKLQRISTLHEGVDSPDYREVASQLRKVRELNPSIRYIYTLRLSTMPNQLEFVVDPDPDPIGSVRRGGTAYPGDLYDATKFPEMLKGFYGPAADRELIEDAWGVALSGYAPVKDVSGHAVAVLGVDMDVSEVRSAQKRMAREFLYTLLLGVLASVLVGTMVSRSLTRRVEHLIDGTRRLSEGDLSRRVVVEGRDEIAELAVSFNGMMDALVESRRKLETHFCNVIEALVRMLEAKDKYTQGHSERVGVYAQKIAVQMGLPEQEAELLRRAGELHDIGKLAVHEHVLNKVEPLTDEEWEMIRRHPGTGYEALKHIGLDDIILSSVHSHHERPDGKGYPQKLDGDKAGLHAQIVSVADAYDAMITTRSYRKAMDRQAVITELRRHSGTQFNPAVVEAMVRIMESDPRFT